MGDCQDGAPAALAPSKPTGLGVAMVPGVSSTLQYDLVLQCWPAGLTGDA
jgi:hypothetical protein